MAAQWLRPLAASVSPSKPLAASLSVPRPLAASLSVPSQLPASYCPGLGSILSQQIYMRDLWRSSSGSGFSPSSSVSPCQSFHQRSLLIFMFLLPEGQSIESWKSPQKQCTLRNLAALERTAPIGKVLCDQRFSNQAAKYRTAFWRIQSSVSTTPDQIESLHVALTAAKSADQELDKMK